MDFKLFTSHDRNNHRCKFPNVVCVCGGQGTSFRYERLTNESTTDVFSPAVPAKEEETGLACSLLNLSFGSPDKDKSIDKIELTDDQELMMFFNDDLSHHSIVVEKNLCASDLCLLLAVRNRVAKSKSWCIIEHWVPLGLERILEDHEYVLSAHNDVLSYSKEAEHRFVFRKDYRKYEFFLYPEILHVAAVTPKSARFQFFPTDMVDMQLSTGKHETVSLNNLSLYQMIMEDNNIHPAIFSQMWVRDNAKDNSWGKAYLLLKDKKIYIAYKITGLAKYIRSSKVSLIPDSAEVGGVKVIAEISNYQIYTTLNAKNQFKAPTEWGICLRPVDLGYEDINFTGLICVACDSEKTRSCWLTAMRLAKYGKQLRENYRAFKNKQPEPINPDEYNRFTVPNESVRSRVAMDFTGSVGRIVDDPDEARAIAASEGSAWARRWRTSSRTITNVPPTGVESGIHITQPWFHSGMSRDQAGALVNRHGTVDGVFLVRESRSAPGAFVLTYKFGGKVVHTPITPLLDPAHPSHVYTLDSGSTKFYDILQLVEFYQLNSGSLPTRLTHYVVQSTNIFDNANGL